MSDWSSLESPASYGPGLLRSMWRYKWSIVVAGVVLGLLGYLLSTLMPAVYEATATISLSETNALTGETAADPERTVQKEASRLTSRAVFSRTGEQFDNRSADGVRRQITVAADSAVGVIEVTAATGDPADAAALANAVTRSYQAVRRDATRAQVEAAREVLETQAEQLRTEIEELRNGSAGDPAAQRRIDSLEAQLFDLEARMVQMDADAALFGAGTDSIEQAVPPRGPSSPQPMRNGAIAAVVGLAVASAFAYWRAGVVDAGRLDPGAVIGAPLLAEIPRFKAVSEHAGASPLFDLEAAEAYQFLVASFEYALAKTNARSVVVTSVSPGDGKSLTALHLARALALQGRDVMLIDSDLRARGLTALLRADDQPGLVALADGEALADVVRRYRISESARLSVIPAGQPVQQPTGLLATDRYREAIAHVIDAHELTVIDAGPLLTVADASAVAAQVSGILMVIDAKVPHDDLLKVQNRLRVVPTPVLGYVLNRVPHAGRTAYSDGVADPRKPGLLRRLFGGVSGRGRRVTVEPGRSLATDRDRPRARLTGRTAA